ncbi:putative MerR family transcriptional regulator [Oscillibacter valericigenes Sjm18-20]|nr:putative MerR family transcriptional regulator [Oscillibacter valericigenes Sjm18-20]
MKIGELAKRAGISRDTIRYYIKNGLLVPEKNDAQYNFSDRELQDLYKIIKMKQQQFNLTEIQNYLSLERLSNLIEPETIDDCLRMMNNKKQELHGQIKKLKDAIKCIDQEVLDLTTRAHGEPQKTGVPISALPLLTCPHCGKQLEISNADLNSRYIFSGFLNCACGYHAKIENGIVKTGNLYTNIYDRPDLRRGLYRNVGQGFSTAVQKCYDYISSELQKRDLNGKVILEANINGYFFLYNHLPLLENGCLCIIIDKFPEMLEMYKGLLELLNLNRDILYISDASMNYPLKPNCVDLHISFFGENEHQLYHHNPYLTDAKQFFKPDVLILGSYLSYSKNSASRKNLICKYPESSSHLYNITYCKEAYNAENYYISYHRVGSLLETASKEYAFECHAKGEPLELYYFKARSASLLTD